MRNIEESKEILKIKLRWEKGRMYDAKMIENKCIKDLLTYTSNIERELIARNNLVHELLNSKKYTATNIIFRFLTILSVTIIVSYYVIAPMVIYVFLLFIVKLGILS